jgi:hypothetical protein
VHAAGQSFASLQIPARFSSVKYLITVCQESATQESKSFYSVTDHIKNQIVSYQHRIGSTNLEPKPVDCRDNAVVAFKNMEKLTDSMSSESYPGLVTLSDWMAQTSAVPPAAPGGFKICASAEPFCGQSRLLSGSSSVASPVFIEVNFDPTKLSDVKACVFSTLVAADALMSINGVTGEMTCQF